MEAAQRIIGLDPGLRYCGWGVIEKSGHHLRFIACGRVCPKSDGQMAARLLQLYQELVAVMNEFEPSHAAVEQIFMNKNPDSTLKLGQARGVALLSAANLGIPVAEYATRTIKQAVVGTGRADKNQVELMVKRLLPQANPKDSDAADALATAICHAHYQ